MSTPNGKAVISLIEMLLLDLTCMAMIGLDAGFLSGAFVWGWECCRAASVMSEAFAMCGGGGGWMASEYKVREKCAHRAVRG